MTEPMRSQVELALSYAGRSPVEDPADHWWAHKRAIVDSELPKIADEVLASSEIASLVAQAGVTPAMLRMAVLNRRKEVLAPADVYLDRMIVADSASRIASLRMAWGRGRRPSVGMIVMGGVLVGVPPLLVGLWTNLAWWFVALSVIGAAVVVLVVGHGAVRDSSVVAETAFASWRQVCRDEGVLPFVRRIVDEHLSPVARTLLGVTTEDAPGLQGVSESSYVVRTRSVEAFLDTAQRLPTGAIGLAGPRGVGKTSLIEHFAGHVRDSDGYGYTRALKVMVSAPVQYEPRDFVLHLFATVCQAVRERPAWLYRPRTDLAVWQVLATVGAVGLAAYMLDYLWLDQVLPPVAVVVAMATGGMVPFLVTFLRERRWEKKGIAGLARWHLLNIRYLQTHTSGWSGKVTLPLSSEAGWSRQTQRERRPQTYPELVAALRNFLEEIARFDDHSPAVIIAVDELDKIESADDAQRFINEIKGIFGAPGTQFLVSVSEDALASFERRGMPVRDAFDSAFHEIVRVDYLTLVDTAELLSSRVIGLPEPFKWLVHCMSGGLPRDVVRTARAMVALTSPDEALLSLDDVCAALVADDLARKSHAFQLACRGMGDSPDVTEFIRSLREFRAEGMFLLTLLPDLRKDGELATLSRQAAAYVYYLATILEAFRRDHVDSHDKDTFDLLARAKQSLAVHPRLAWLLVDEFRTVWGLDTAPVD